MSGFMNRNAGIDQQMLRTHPDCNQPVYNWSSWWGADSINPWEDGAIWSNSSLQGGSYSLSTVRWATAPHRYGSQSMKKFIGTTRDSTGATLGGAVVHAHLTPDGSFVGKVTADAGGYFELCSKYPDTNHYLVAYKSDSPDVAGTSLNTLLPT